MIELYGDTVARLIADLYAGKLHPRVAAGLGPLLHLQLRAIDGALFAEAYGHNR